MWARSSLIFYANCSLHVWESFLLFGNLYSFVLQENKAAGRTLTKHLTDVTAHQLSVQFMCLPFLFHWKRSGSDIWSLLFLTKAPKKKKKDCVSINDLLLCLGATVLQDFTLMVLSQERTNLTNFINSSLF